MSQIPSESPQEISFVTSLIGGAISSALVKTAFAPIDRVHLLKIIADKERYRSGVKPPSTMREIVSQQGFLALWRGNYANIIRYCPSQALNFAFKDAIGQRAKSFFDLNIVYANFLSGGVAGALSLVITYPLVFERVHLAHIAREGSSLYKGISHSLPGVIVYRAMYFGMYDSLKIVVPSHNGVEGLARKLAVAFSTTIVTNFFVMPFDAVRRRILLEYDLNAHKRLYSGTIDCFRKVAKREGISAFWKGMTSSIFRSQAAIVLVGYDYVVSAFKS